MLFLLYYTTPGPVTYGPHEAVGAPDHPHRGLVTVTYILEVGESKQKRERGGGGENKCLTR